MTIDFQSFNSRLVSLLGEMNQATLPGPTVVQTLGCMTFLLHPSISGSGQMLTLHTHRVVQKLSTT